MPALLILTGVLAVTSLVGDSVTFDETAHLTSGMSYLETGDFRLSPEHPPLGKLWAAWPLLFVDHRWPPSDGTYWRDADVFGVGRDWLFRLNDGQRLVVIARCMMVILLLATCLTTYALARMLFGPSAGLLALTLATLSPTLLAHGRLVTTDLPITLWAALTLLTFARLMQRVTWLRLLAAALALTATSLSKFSWPLVLPALAVMAMIAIFRRQPLEVAAGSRPAGKDARPQPPRMLNDRAQSRANPPVEGPRGLKPAALHCRTIAHGHLARRRDRAAILLGSALCIGLVVWLGIWTCYGWRISVVAPLTAAEDTPQARAQFEHTIERIALDWERSLNYPHAPLRPVLPGLLRLTADTGLMPDAYLLGLALTLLYSGARSAYLLGAYSDSGWLSYFPLAFCMKTPLATLLLLVAGVLAMRRAVTRSRDTVLLTGLIVFAAAYAGFLINGRLNIGVRHLMPVYPVVFVFAGAAAGWVSIRAGRWLVAGAVIWLLAANLWTYPHYLAYFNELSGGPARGHLRLADSNIDWGQDLLRLADYARQHPNESIKLAYFGSAIPTHYLRCTALPSFQGFAPHAELTAGTYVVSVTQLLGVWDRELRPTFWDAKRRRAYQTLGQIAAAPPSEDETPEEHARRAEATKEYGELRYKRLLSRLGFNGQRERQPDDRIGYSLFVYRLTDADVEQLTRP